MKPLDSYFKFIGINNKGWQRIILIMILVHVILCILYWINCDNQMNRVSASALTRRYYQEEKYYLFITLFGGIIGFSLLLRILRWVKEGFKEQ